MHPYVRLILDRRANIFLPGRSLQFIELTKENQTEKILAEGPISFLVLLPDFRPFVRRCAKDQEMSI